MGNPSTIDIWRKELEHTTLTEAVILLRALGSFQYDKLTVLFTDPKFRGYRRFAFCDLLDYMSAQRYCRHIYPVYFSGGPMEIKQFKGTLLTMVLDRVMLTSENKGADVAFKAVDYARGFRERRISVGGRDARPSDSCTRTVTRGVLGLA